MDTRASTNAGVAARLMSDGLLAKGAHLNTFDAPRRDRPRRLPSFAAIAGVAGVLATSLIRNNLQAHLALAPVGEQPPS
ncbi:MAG: hypothetical protein WAL38_19765 [Solirubrobacteraceae bacterium]